MREKKTNTRVNGLRAGKDINKLGSLQKLLEQPKVVAAVFRNVKFCKYHLNQTQRKIHNKTRQLLMPVDSFFQELLQRPKLDDVFSEVM